MWNAANSSSIKQQVTIAIIDTGVNTELPSLASSIWKNNSEIPYNNRDDDHNGYVDDVCGWNFVQNNNNPSSYDFFPGEIEHGTRIVEILSSAHGKATIWGIATNPDINIMPLKVGSCNNDGNIRISAEAVVRAIKYAENNGANICNISLNSSIDYPRMRNYIKNSKMLFVVSAGNKRYRNDLSIYPSYPAVYQFENLITVGNLTSMNTH